MADFRVVVTDDRFGSYEEEKSVLDALGCSLEVCDLANGQEADEKLRAADGILLNMFPMTSARISALERCRVISRYGVGYDNVDIEAATAKGIWVARVPDYGYEEVSDHSLAMLLGLSRNLAYVDRRVREGGWNLKNEYRTHRIRGSILGIVGFGRIGRALCRKAAGLGFSRILVYDPYVSSAAVSRRGAESVNLPTLLGVSDYVTLHLPLTDETRGLIDEAALRTMKSTAMLINTSRGGIVDETALADALEAGTIAGAGLDVHETEPIPEGSRLKTLPRVILSDHTAYYSEESIVELKQKAARNIAEVLSGGEPLYPVNRPVSTA